jgi:hypothetical protein
MRTPYRSRTDRERAKIIAKLLRRAERLLQEESCAIAIQDAERGRENLSRCEGILLAQIWSLGAAARGVEDELELDGWPDEAPRPFEVIR